MTTALKASSATRSAPERTRAVGARRARRGRSAHGARRTALVVEGLSVTAPDGTTLVDDVSFSVEAGSLVAVVGPTGAGKSTLLRALTGDAPLASGSVRVYGGRAHGRVGYVPQENVLHSQLDLRRTLDDVASLQLGGAVDAAARRERVQAVLGELGLVEQARLQVGVLSGGQQKRANVAAELVSEPDVLVLDEPTSGLDPGYEKNVLGTLRRLAQRGRTVLAVTHSLRALELCDRVLFLAPGGRVAFFGPPQVAAAYFDTDDAAEVFLSLDADGGEGWKERFRSHPAYRRYVAPRATADPSPAHDDSDAHPRMHAGGTLGRQVRTLVGRYAALIRADRRHAVMLALEGPLLGLLLLAVLSPHGLARPHFTNHPNLTAKAVGLFFAISVTWLGVSNTVREIVKERRILRAEVGRGLSLRAYVSAKAMVLGTVTIGQAAALTFVGALRQNPPPGGSALGNGRLELVVVVGLVAAAGVGLGLLLSALVDSPEKALTVLPVTLVAQLVCSGAFPSVLSQPGVAQLRNVTGTYWGVQAVEATVRGDAAGWWRAVIMLVGLTALALMGASAVLRRRLGVVDAGHDRRRRAGLVVGIALLATVVVTGVRVTQRRPEHLAVKHPTPATTVRKAEAGSVSAQVAPPPVVGAQADAPLTVPRVAATVAARLPTSRAAPPDPAPAPTPVPVTPPTPAPSQAASVPQTTISTTPTAPTTSTTVGSTGGGGIGTASTRTRPTLPFYWPFGG